MRRWRVCASVDGFFTSTRRCEGGHLTLYCPAVRLYFNAVVPTNIPALVSFEVFLFCFGQAWSALCFSYCPASIHTNEHNNY